MTTTVPDIDESFYVTGGTLPPDARSYIARNADDALYNALLAGETCYVLNSRQMGKSSLCVRTIERLKAAGARTVFLDLTKFGGKNLTVEQWYAALLNEIGRELDCRSALFAYWKANEALPFVQRVFGALTDIALAVAPSSIVVFVDEIDITRTLPFETDEFFAAIRQCVVGRATDAKLKRLAFCLLGTAAPQDLIQNTDITPFNVGKRIELSDFTPQEAALLAAGLSHGEHGEHGESGGKLLQRVLFWTNGHPYLTQRLCSAIVEAHIPTPDTPHLTPSVDTLCHHLFLSHAATESDDNLANVRNRLLKNDLDTASLLTLYGQIRAGKRVPDDETNPLCVLLKLSGVAKVENGLLKVRNRIYATVFDAKWVTTHMPDAELRRQKEAYRRGVTRTGVWAGAIITLFVCLAAFAFSKANEARSNAREVGKQTKLAQQNEQLAQQIAKKEVSARADANEKAQEAVDLEHIAHKQTLLAQQRLHDVREANAATKKALTKAQQSEEKAKKQARRAEQAKGKASNEARRARKAEQIVRQQRDRDARDLYIANMKLVQKEWDSNNIGRVLKLLEATRKSKFRNLEWSYWNRQCHLDLKTLKGHTGFVTSVCFSPDSKRIVTGSDDNTAKVWDAQTGQETLTLKGHTNAISSVCFSPDGKRIVTGSGDKTAKVWDVQTNKELLTLTGHKETVTSVCYSPDGRQIVTGSDDATAKIWDAQTGHQMLTLTEQSNFVLEDNTDEGQNALKDKDVDEAIKVLKQLGKDLNQREAKENRRVLSVCFSPDGRQITTGCKNATAKVWDTRTGQKLFTLEGHTERVSLDYSPVCYSPDGSRIVMAGENGTVKMWNAQTGHEILTFEERPSSLLYNARTGYPILTRGSIFISVCFSPDSRRIVTGSWDKKVQVWDAQTGRETLAFKGHTGVITSVCFSPDGKRIVTGSDDGTAKIWISDLAAK